MAYQLTIEDTKHIADLSNLILPLVELETLTQMFSDTLDYIAILDELDVSKVTETSQVTGLVNVYQTSGIGETTLTQKEALKNATNTRDNKFVTKAVFER